MKQIINIIMMIFGVGLFILGLFDMQETRFGFASHTSTLGVVIMGIFYLDYRINILRKRIENGRRM